MTMKELAKLTNVSVSTVSKAFNDAEDVGEETRALIFETAKRHGCFLKYYKGKYSKRIIAIICPEVRSGYYAGYVERLQEVIEREGGIVLISADHFSKAAQAELIEYYAGFLKVDGIFVFNMKTPLKKGLREIPIVSVFGARDVGSDSVNVDTAAPMREAVEHLYGLGHRRIAFIGEPLTGSKEEQFRAACEGLGLRPVCIRSEGRFAEAGKEGAQRLLELEERPTAAICAYDDIAIGLIRKLKKSGIRVPEDLSVIGMDDINTSEHLETSLTTIDSNPAEVCTIAWELLEKKLQNCYYRLNQRITVTGRLLIRETTAPASRAE